MGLADTALRPIYGPCVNFRGSVALTHHATPTRRLIGWLQVTSVLGAIPGLAGCATHSGDSAADGSIASNNAGSSGDGSQGTWLEASANSSDALLQGDETNDAESEGAAGSRGRDAAVVQDGAQTDGNPGPVTALHYASGGGVDANGKFAAGAYGFNLADVSTVGEVNSLPAGMMGLVWLGLCNGADGPFVSTVQPFVGNPKVFGFYIADEPDPTGGSNPVCPVANLKAESDWIHTNAPATKTFIVMMNLGSTRSPSYANTYNPSNTGIDLYGLDPYPCRTDLNGCEYSMINVAVPAALAEGIPLASIVPVYQAFGGGGWTDDTGGAYLVPTIAEENQVFATWAAVTPSPVFDYAYSWGVQNGDTALSTAGTGLQQTFAIHNH
jgi:hypothetical protein